jgi:hypothetical protein
MLIELWERLRGFDKWTQTEAKIKSSNLAEVEIGSVRVSRWSDSETVDEWESNCTLAWTDAAGKPHEADFTVAEDSSLFQLYDGQTVTIRYNPSNPDQFHLRGVFGSKFHTGLKRTMILLANLFSRH